MSDSSDPDGDRPENDAPHRFGHAGGMTGRIDGQALVPTEPAETALDAHGHDPDRYQWVPVLRKPRKDGWTPRRRRTFKTPWSLRTLGTFAREGDAPGDATVRHFRHLCALATDRYPDAMTYAKDATPPFYHGTRADLAVGDLLAPGFSSNYQERKLSWIYFSGTLDAAIWGCELAAGDACERIYIVEPTGAFEDDPNLTDKKFPGNPTQSYRSREPLRITGEVMEWEPHPPERLKEMKDALARMAAEGDMRIID